MNILFVLYGDFTSNSANPLALYARELSTRGHTCAIAVPSNIQTVSLYENPDFRPVLYEDVLASPASAFPNNAPADVLHACTPREVVRRFITLYLSKHPTPLIFYLEDNEPWLTIRSLGLDEDAVFQYTAQELTEMTPLALTHPYYGDCLVGLADAVAVIQDKLKSLVPSWVYCKTVMIGVDLEFFSPRAPVELLKKKYGLADSDKVIVYHGGINDFTRPGIQTLCEAVGLINQRGIACRLLRTGLSPLDFRSELSEETNTYVLDLGLLPKKDLPALLSLADVFVQPGKKGPYEDLRLPGKVPECLAMGLPVLMPDANISYLFEDGENIILLSGGTAEEIAQKCIELFLDPQKAKCIGQAGRLLAEKKFDVRQQSVCLEEVYSAAQARFDPAITAQIWQAEADDYSPVFRLARKLIIVGEKENNWLLQEHGRLLEDTAKRLNAVENRLVENRSVKEVIVALPPRICSFLLNVFSKPVRKFLNLGRFDDDIKFLLKKGVKVYHREGWSGLRFRLQKRFLGL